MPRKKSKKEPSGKGSPRSSSAAVGSKRERPSRPEELSAGLVALLRLVPNYDPFVGAEEMGCWFDEDAAQRAVDFFPQMLTHIEGADAKKPFVLSPWQASATANLFGWKREDAKGREIRRYKNLFVYVPRKNGKTPWCAGIGLYVFFCDDEAGQQGYIAAKDKEQAGKLFRQMEGMVRANDMLAGRCRAYGGNAPAGNSKSFVKDDNSFLQVISGDAGGKHGGMPHLVIVDELHEQSDRELIDTLRTSLTSENRKQALMLELTTADFDRPSICNERYDFAKRVQADPKIDPAFLPVIYEADAGDPWDAEETWEKCNPNLDVSVSREALRRLANESVDNPALLIEFRRLHTNVKMQKTVNNAIDLILWDGCRSELPLNGELDGKPCWCGLDLGWRDDFAALVRLWEVAPLTVFGDFRFWLPKGGKRDLRHSPFREFVAGQWLKLTEGNTTDFAEIREALNETRERYELKKLIMDPSYARSEATELMNAEFPVEEFKQNTQNYSGPWKWLVADGMKSKKLQHGGNPIMRWMAGNVAIVVSGTDGVMPYKKKSKDKIDGISALCMGLAGWLADPTRGGSEFVYDVREPMIM